MLQVSDVCLVLSLSNPRIVDYSTSALVSFFLRRRIECTFGTVPRVLIILSAYYGLGLAIRYVALFCVCIVFHSNTHSFLLIVVEASGLRASNFNLGLLFAISGSEAHNTYTNTEMRQTIK